jgi:hypothetical protein
VGRDIQGPRRQAVQCASDERGILSPLTSPFSPLLLSPDPVRQTSDVILSSLFAASNGLAASQHVLASHKHLAHHVRSTYQGNYYRRPHTREEDEDDE